MLYLFVGIEYLIENRLLRHDSQDVAHFLYKGEGLNKTAIGEWKRDTARERKNVKIQLKPHNA